MYSFCPKCGGNLRELHLEEHNRSRWICSNCDFIFYQNSKPCVGILVINNKEVLLVQRAIEPFKGFWDIPGGFLEVGEHPKDGAIREILEETGLVIEPIEILGIFMDEYGKEKESTLNICYTAKVNAGQLLAASDALDAKWFSINALPSNVAFEWSEKALLLLQKKLRN